eukprot:9500494-Alexandrium_andersonii.AAC.1
MHCDRLVQSDDAGVARSPFRLSPRLDVFVAIAARDVCVREGEQEHIVGRRWHRLRPELMAWFPCPRAGQA